MSNTPSRDSTRGEGSPIERTRPGRQTIARRDQKRPMIRSAYPHRFAQVNYPYAGTLPGPQIAFRRVPLSRNSVPISVLGDLMLFLRSGGGKHAGHPVFVRGAAKRCTRWRFGLVGWRARGRADSETEAGSIERRVPWAACLPVRASLCGRVRRRRPAALNTDSKLSVAPELSCKSQATRGRTH
jgi:hypothetical protein